MLTARRELNECARHHKWMGMGGYVISHLSVHETDFQSNFNYSYEKWRAKETKL